ncbi:MAG: hypothetical protein WC495_00465 [Patescibacteria group bacterium]|jgi:hypothetical protein
MSIAVIFWQSTFSTAALYDTSVEKLISAHLLQGDLFLESLDYLIQQKKNFSRIFVIFGIERFSLTRQVTLLTNVLAEEYGCKVASFRINSLCDTQDMLLEYIQHKLPKMTWKDLIAPQYAKEPNITKQKRCL